jgi:hypothetical protein
LAVAAFSAGLQGIARRFPRPKSGENRPVPGQGCVQISQAVTTHRTFKPRAFARMLALTSPNDMGGKHSFTVFL